MMAYLRYGFAALVAAVFVTVALANRALVEVKLLPDALASLFGFNFEIRLPLFLLLALAVGAGLLLGFIWEWLREHGIRAEAAQLRREKDAMRDELKRVEKIAPQTRKDDVLALVEGK
ncbi:MAG: lipopolysaccharide assembly protein LapA domain-containing protein [Roseinatronobacter sp.]